MDHIENGMYAPNGSFTEAHKTFPMHYGLWEGGMFNVYFNIFNCTKYSEINIGHSDVQKHGSFE